MFKYIVASIISIIYNFFMMFLMAGLSIGAPISGSAGDTPENWNFQYVLRGVLIVFYLIASYFFATVFIRQIISKTASKLVSLLIVYAPVVLLVSYVFVYSLLK